MNKVGLMFESFRRDFRGINQEGLDYSVCVQFLFMHVACLLVIWTGISAVAVTVCLALYVVRMFAITAGFHRLFAHRSYRTGRIFRFMMAFIGTASYQKGPLWWAAHHRNHHLHSDTETDLHSPLAHSLWRSHVGWFLSRASGATDRALVSNLLKHRDLRWLDRYYHVPPFLLAAGTFLLGMSIQHYFPGAGTSGWQMLVWGFFISTVLLYHGTFTVNSLAHIFGKRRFATEDGSRNNWFVALITLGEGWHNNHHYYPSSERQGFYWWEIDIAHYALRMLSWLGVVWDLRTPPSNVSSIQINPATNKSFGPTAP
jgi:stearoyl-CoA desaturase (Delta-9 desaturase)